MDFKRKQTGFGLIETSLVLGALAIAATVFVAQIQEADSQSDKNTLWLTTADYELKAFAAEKGRLPCPSITNDGTEDCTIHKGFFPYRTIGMSENQFGRGDTGILYGVYRKQNTTLTATRYAADADLAVLKNRYEPMRADGTYFAHNLTNSIDFCSALTTAAAATQSDSYVFMQTPAGVKRNVAYALAYPGANGVFNGINTTPRGFEVDYKQVTPDYDDQIRYQDFASFRVHLKCDSIVHSLNAMATAVQTKVEVDQQAADAATAAKMGAIMAGVGVALLVYDAVLAGVDMANAVTTLATAIGLLSGAVASCVVLVGCAFIPVYTAAVALATTGVVLSGVAIGATVAATVSQAIATGLYIDIAVRANTAANAVGNVDYTVMITDMQSKIATEQAELATLQSQATTARGAANASLTVAQQRFNSLVAFARASDDPAVTTDPAVVGQLVSVRTKMDQARTADDAVSTAQGDLAIIKENCKPDAAPTAPECSTIAAKEAAIVVLQSTVTAANTAVSSALGTAYTGANNHPFSYTYYDFATNQMITTIVSCSTTNACRNSLSPTTVRNAMGDPAYPLDIGFTVLPQVDGSYLDYLSKDKVADSKESLLTGKQQGITEMQNSLAGMQCLAAGMSFNSTTKVCSAVTPTTPGTAINVAGGAEAILRGSDEQGLTE